MKAETEMATKKARQPIWLADAEDHDFPDAESYLTLIYSGKRAAKIVAKLRAAGIVQYQAKDIFRASQLSLLGISNSHIEKNRQKIKTGTGLPPILLVRDKRNRKVIVADGYHRLCAVYEFDEDAWIPCKVV